MSRNDHAEGAEAYLYRYPMVSVATDVVLLNLSRGGGLWVALVRRRPDAEAYADRWALPGGFLKAGEDSDLEACVRRELLEEVGVENPHLELIGVYSAIDRDPRPERVISIAYLSVLLSDEPEVAPITGTDVVEARWVPLCAYRAPSVIEMLSDNGSPYIAKDTQIFARQLGLKPCFTPIRSQQSNGILETFVKTLKRDYVQVTPLPDAKTVLGLIGGWIEDCNDNHPHSGLKMRSPREFIAAQTATA
jgi:ADP-ribose pyrophosphatase YjhB (NUDIX family)